MSREKDPECRGYLVRETDSAMLVRKMIHTAPDETEYWIPRSQIGYCRKTYDAMSDATEIVFTIPEWLIEKKQCWELVP